MVSYRAIYERKPVCTCLTQVPDTGCNIWCEVHGHMIVQLDGKIIPAVTEYITTNYSEVKNG